MTLPDLAKLFEGNDSTQKKAVKKDEIIMSTTEENIVAKDLTDGKAESISKTPTEEEDLVKTPEPTLKVVNGKSCKLTQLNTWINSHTLPKGIKTIKLSITGIDADSNVMISVPLKEDGDDRELFLFKGANTTPVLDLGPTETNFYNNGMRIIYNLDDKISLTSYSKSKSNLILIVSTLKDNIKIPYSKLLIKRTSEKAEFNDPLNDIYQKLDDKVNIEELKILYPPIKKYDKKIETKKDILNYFQDLQQDIIDVNHHLKIEDILISLFT